MTSSPVRLANFSTLLSRAVFIPICTRRTSSVLAVPFIPSKKSHQAALSFSQQRGVRPGQCAYSTSRARTPTEPEPALLLTGFANGERAWHTLPAALSLLCCITVSPSTPAGEPW